MATHIFSTQVQSLVAGIDDTAIALVDADSAEAAAEKVTKQSGATGLRQFRGDMWKRDPIPAHSGVHYLGTVEEALEDHEDGILITEHAPISTVEELLE